MGKIVTAFSMSLDGFIAGPEEEFAQLFQWYSTGDTEFRFADGRTVKVSAASAALLQEALATTGALVTGRRLFDLTHGWGGRHPIGVPVVVVTHTVPADWPHAAAPFTFVTDGLESALAQAQHIAGDKNVALASASIVQQCLKAGLLDEINIDLVPFLLGSGVSLFTQLGIEPIALETTRVVATPHVTHLRFRVLKQR